MDLTRATALVTGANRGLGRALAVALIDRGASVYAGARDPDRVDVAGAKPLRLDLTDPTSVEEAAAAARDVTLLVNNAGSATREDLLTGDLASIRLDMETHFFGTLAVTRAFAPLIEGNGGGTVLNILSVLSWITLPRVGAYSAAKSAEWSLTNALRLQLAPRGIRVAGLHVGYMDTDMARGVTGPKADPHDVARAALDALAADADELVVDEISKDTLARLSGGVAALYPQLTA